MTTLNRWQRTVVDLAGNIVPGAVLMVRRESDQALVTVYKDRAGTQAYPMGQVTADGMGYAYFYAPADLYRITSAAPSIDWRDIDIGAAAAQSIAQQALDSALPTYETVVEMNADTGQDVPTLGRVVNAVDPDDNGYYVWDGSTWARSSYQPASDADVQARLRRDQNLADLDDAAAARGNLGLGTAAVEDAGAFATAAQGEAADSAVQPSRKVEGGDGLAGGGDLSEDRIITLSGQTKYDLDQLYAQLRRAEYGDGPYPAFDQVFGAGASMLDPRITHTRPGKSWRIVNGVLREYDVNEPVLTPEGWSLRPAETNLAWPSENLGAWNTQGASISGAKGPSPDGGNAAEYLVPTTIASGVAQAYKTFTVTPNTDYVVYVFGRADAYGRSYLQTNFGGSFATGTTHFDLVAGTVLAVNPALTAGVMPLSGGWYLTWHTGKTGASQTSLQVSVGCCPPGSLTGTGSTPGAVSGDGVSGIWVFGGLLALGSSPIPYIPTTSGSVTRPADNASIQGADFADVFNPVEGAIVIDSIAQMLGSDTANKYLWLVGASGLPYMGVSLLAGSSNLAFRFEKAGSGPTNVTLDPSYTPSSRYKVGVSWSGPDLSISLNGEKVADRSSGIDLGLMGQLIFNGGLVANNTAASVIARARIFNRRPSDAQMEAMTS